MRNVLRLGLAAAALGTAVLAPSASAHDHCPLWLGTDERLPVWAVAVCTVEAPGSIPVIYRGGTVVCHKHVADVWVQWENSGGYLVNNWENTVANRTGSQPHCTPDLAP